MDFHEINCVGPLYLEMLDELPQFDSLQSGRVVFNGSDKKIYFGGISDWNQLISNQGIETIANFIVSNVSQLLDAISNASDGAVIYLKPGLYEISTTILVEKPLSLMGVFGSEILADGDFTLIGIGNSTSRILVEGITFNATNLTSTTPVGQIAECSEVMVKNNLLINPNGCPQFIQVNTDNILIVDNIEKT